MLRLSVVKLTQSCICQQDPRTFELLKIQVIENNRILAELLSERERKLKEMKAFAQYVEAAVSEQPFRGQL